MNNKLFLAGAVVVGLVVGYLLFSANAGNLGATVNYTNSLNQVNLYNSLESITRDINNLRSVSANSVSTTTTAFGPGALGPIGSTTSTASTTFTVTGAVIGDVIAISPSTTTASIVLWAQVTASNTVQLVFLNAATTNNTPATSTYFFVDESKTAVTNAMTAITTTSTSN